MAYTTINKSSLHFTPKLYTGNNGASLTISGLNFQPDLTWIKARNATETHGLYDIIRGALYRLQSNSSNASTSTTGTVTGWTSDGFSLGTSDEVNGTYNYASWNWKANGAGSANTDGTINTLYTSANTTSGFSISTYTGTGSAGTIGHGLGVAPTAIWIKKTSGTENWFCWNNPMTSAGGFMKLDTNSAISTNNTAFPWNPQANTFGVSTDAATNASGSTYVAYCFADVQGYSKMGGYVGNGNTDGTFVYTGFKPAFVMIKSRGGDNWRILDNKRLGYNANNSLLFPNITQAESALTWHDLLSNGFKLRTTDSGDNTNGENYIYMAFAEAPLVGSNNVPANAR